MVRTILLDRLGYTRTELKAVLKRGRRRIREANEPLIGRWLIAVASLPADAQARTILEQAWPGRKGVPEIEWAIVSDAIRRLNVGSPEYDRRRRWCVVDPLRRYEKRSALKEWESREIGAYLLIMEP